MTEIQVADTRGGLGALFTTLRDELAQVPRGTWVRRRLKRGAVVSVARHASGRRVLLLSRDKAPSDDRKAVAWNAEVDTFLRWFGAKRWEQLFELPAAALAGTDAAVWSAFMEPPESER